MLLQVTESTEGKIEDWDKNKIVTVLTDEINIPKEDAEKIANTVEKKVMSSGVKKITVNLIRELVNSELFSNGFNKKLAKHETIGMSFFDLDKLILNKSKENSNVFTNNPEAVNLAIAENTLKQYALKKIFSEEVSTAHLNGTIHLHDIGYPVRLYCSAHSIEFIKKYGLELSNLSTASKPAKYASTLTGHLNTFLASIQAYYAGALGLHFLNIFYAPFLVGMTEKEMKQEAQYLIYSCSQNAFSRGGQVLFIDFNIHLEIPEFLKDVEAIGPEGKYTGKTYSEYEKETQKFAKALMEVWLEGDRDGKPMPFPKMDLHINDNTFKDKKQLELFKLACNISSENGLPYFIFDRDSTTVAACCRLRSKITDEYTLKHPEYLNFCGFQNVSINLPQASYKAGKGNIDGTISEIYKAMKLAVKAHIQKKKFIEKLMSTPNMPLWELGKISRLGKPYVELDKATYIIGIVGLNDCVHYLTDKELHESDESYKIGLQIISSMYLKTKELEKETGLKLSIEESPAESCFSGETLIKTITGDFPIKDLVGKKIGVWSYNEKTRKICIKNAYNIRKTKNNAEIIRIHFDNKTYIDCTPEHLIACKTTQQSTGSVIKWIQAKNLGIGKSVKSLYIKPKKIAEKLKCTQGIVQRRLKHEKLNHKIIKIEKLIKRENVYNMEVEGTECFFAGDGILVHNCVRRFAKIDLKNYPEAKEIVKGDKKNDEVYYVNSTHLAPDAQVDILERIEKQSKFNPLIESGAITHVFVGEQKPDPDAIFSLIKKTWENTQCAQLTISPEFTICNTCKKLTRGYKSEKPVCSFCNSEDVYGMSRVVGYFSKIENWNKSKQAEFKDRQRGDYKVG